MRIRLFHLLQDLESALVYVDLKGLCGGAEYGAATSIGILHPLVKSII